MKETRGELWEHYGKPNEIVLVTTNGTITRDGRAVMGRGCAYEAKLRLPSIDADLGAMLRAGGNNIHALDFGRIYSFPVKHEWYQTADIALIKKSAQQLTTMALRLPENVFVLPRPGCGNGRLMWDSVRPVIHFLPDNVWVINKN